MGKFQKKEKAQRTVEVTNQAKFSKKALIEIYGSQEFKKIQGNLYTYCRKFDMDNLDTTKSNMIVIKKAEGFYKGQKVINHAEKQKVVEVGGSYRNITFLKSKESQKFSKGLSKLINVSLKNQHGFVRKKGIYDAARQILATHKETPVVDAVNIDLKNAFNAIPKAAVYKIFRIVFDLNHKDSETLTKLATFNGYLYQGCPFAPQLYNVWVIGAIRSIEKMGFHVAAYADDLTVFSTKDRITWNVIFAIKKRVQFWNFSINPKKVRRFQLQTADNLDTVGLKISLVGGFAEPLSFRKQARKLAFFVHLFLAKDFRYTRRFNKDGMFIQIYQLIQGLYNWLEESHRRYSRKLRKIMGKLQEKVRRVRKIYWKEKLETRQGSPLLEFLPIQQ